MLQTFSLDDFPGSSSQVEPQTAGRDSVAVDGQPKLRCERCPYCVHNTFWLDGVDPVGVHPPCWVSSYAPHYTIQWVGQFICHPPDHGTGSTGLLVTSSTPRVTLLQTLYTPALVSPKNSLDFEFIWLLAVQNKHHNVAKGV